MANSHSAEICPPYRASQGSPRFAASALIRSACRWAAWCFQSLAYACGRPANAPSSLSGVPSASVGRIVQAVKSVAMPIDPGGSTAAAATALGTAS